MTAPPVVDAHTDLLLELVARRQEAAPFRDSWRGPLLEGGVRLQVCPIYLWWDDVPDRAIRSVLDQIAAWRRAGAENADVVTLVRTGEDLDAVVAGERLGLLLAIEGAEALGSDPELIDTYWELGVRMLGLTHFQRNAFADGNGEAPHGGLSALGRMLVARLERLGVVIDLAHSSEATFAEVLEAAPSARVLVSHAGCRALCDTPRNHSDAQLRALAQRGGVLGVYAVPMFLGDGGHRLDRMVDHILHAMEVAGPEHVGLGGDFMAQLSRVPGLVRLPPWLPIDPEQASAAVDGLPGPEGYPRLAEALQRRGVDGALLAGVLGGNFLRLYEEALPRQEGTR